MPGMSLARRLLAGAVLWSLLVLVGGGLALSAVYRSQTLQLLDEELDGTLMTLARAVDVTEDGALNSNPAALPSDTRYLIQLSGRYWSIVGLTPDGFYAEDERPASLWDGDIPWPESKAAELVEDPGTVFYGSAIGPNGERLRTAAQAIILESRETPILLVAAADRQQADESAERYTFLLLAAMSALAAGLLAAMWGGVRVALRPLGRVETDVADVREGRKTRLSDDYPIEVRPLSAELNKLLDHNREVVERARTHVGNLAHALKTPLAVLRNEATGDTGLDDVVRRQTEAMRANVEHYLKRAQAAARAETLGARAEVRPVIDGLARMLNKLFADKGITVSALGGAGVHFRGEKQDLEEMLGNLMENACKWAGSLVKVSVETEGASMMLIHVDDDGVGLNEAERVDALKRGVRLDETAPGTGLGLSIVTELAGMHTGGLTLARSPEGGLRATLKLPTA